MDVYFLKSFVWQENLNSPHCPDPWPAPLRLQRCLPEPSATSRKIPAEYRGQQQLSCLQLASHLLGDTTAIIGNSKINYFLFDTFKIIHIYEKSKFKTKNYPAKLKDEKRVAEPFLKEPLKKKMSFPSLFRQGVSLSLSSSGK